MYKGTLLEKYFFFIFSGLFALRKLQMKVKSSDISFYRIPFEKQQL